MRLAVLTALLAVTARAWAGDLGIDADLPLRVEDAEPTDEGELQLQTSAIYQREAHGVDAVEVLPRLKYGITRDLDVQIQTPLLVGEGDITGSRQLQARSQWRVLHEDGAFVDAALQPQLDFPTGRNSAGVDVRLEGILTKTIASGASHDQLDLDATWTHNAAARSDERDDRYTIVVGYTRRVLPWAMFVADVVRDQQAQRGMTSNLIEIGLLATGGDRLTVGAGVGAGIAEESPDVIVTVAVQYAIVSR